MYSIIRPKKNEPELFGLRLAKLADRAWHGYSEHDFEWRKVYYSTLLQSNHALNSYRLITFQDLDAVEEYDISFAAILPLENRFAKLHLNGDLSQYSFSNEHLKISTRDRGAKTYHYVQSVWMDKHHLKSRDAKLTLKAAMLEMLEKQKCGWESRSYVLYAETSLSPGENLSVSQGLVSTELFSAEKKRFYLHDSDKGRAKLSNAIDSIWV